ncbi:MAG: twin-arginine translocase TatA/TatE family subunit [Firmicutes bacterium]|nr:twin-arginine translocase TatA/TatE family subunit [Bacillota bacterium]
MFLGMGPSELILILALALIIFGPRKLPEIAKSLGKAIGEFKKASQGIQDAVQKDLVKPIAAIAEQAQDEPEQKGKTGEGSKDNEPQLSR